MPRRPLIETDLFPYHVTSRSNNKEWFYLPIDQCWQIFTHQLTETSVRYGLYNYAFTLMSNHFHLMLLTPMSNLGEVMRHFTTGVSKAIQKSANRINHIFGARYKWSLLCDSSAVACGYKYVLRNPIRAGIVERVEDYPFQTFTHQSTLPIVDGTEPLWSRVPKETEERRAWLNRPTRKELEVLITQGLRREAFQFSMDNAKQKAIRQLQASYGIDPLG